MQHGDGEMGQFFKTLHRELHRLQGQQLERLARDALGVVAHAFEFEVELDRGVGKPEQTGHGLLLHDEFKTQAVHPFPVRQYTGRAE